MFSSRNFTGWNIQSGLLPLWQNQEGGEVEINEILGKKVKHKQMILSVW